MTVSKPLGGLRQPQRVINLPDLVQGWAFVTDRWIWMIQLDVVAARLLLLALAYQLNLNLTLPLVPCVGFALILLNRH